MHRAYCVFDCNLGLGRPATANRKELLLLVRASRAIRGSRSGGVPGSESYTTLYTTGAPAAPSGEACLLEEGLSRSAPFWNLGVAAQGQPVSQSLLWI